LDIADMDEYPLLRENWQLRRDINDKFDKILELTKVIKDRTETIEQLSEDLGSADALIHLQGMVLKQRDEKIEQLLEKIEQMKVALTESKKAVEYAFHKGGYAWCDDFVASEILDLVDKALQDE
jgi:seryl-tRNA synthetase